MRTASRSWPHAIDVLEDSGHVFHDWRQRESIVPFERTGYLLSFRSVYVRRIVRKVNDPLSSNIDRDPSRWNMDEKVAYRRRRLFWEMNVMGESLRFATAAQPEADHVDSR